MNSLISVIMGVYNAENTLKQAIESIINQTYENWELIICDDGSTDDSFRIIREFQDPRIIAMKNQENMGLGYALNRCLNKAKGLYIARMDADDISLSTRLEKEIEFLKNNPQYAVVSTAIKMLTSYGEFSMEIKNSDPEPKDFIIGSPIAHPACMMRKECLDDVGGYNEGKNTLRVEDTDLWIRLLKKGYKFYILPEPLYKWRFNYDSVHKQKLIYRLNGTIVRLKGCKELNLPFYYYLLSFRTVIIGLIPTPIRYIMHQRRMKR